MPSAAEINSTGHRDSGGLIILGTQLKTITISQAILVTILYHIILYDKCQLK